VLDSAAIKAHDGAVGRSTPILCFGSFGVDIASGELRRQGLKRRLQEQPFQLVGPASRSKPES
jgi:hypothetical protein